jgi:uncharacterized protein YndB with AHSA1/START domain
MKMATPPQPPAGPTIHIRRLFNANRNRMFSAWTEPQQVAQWLCCAPGYKTEHLEFDARVGGRYLIRNTSPTGDVHNIRGEFREVQPPAKLAFTWGGFTVRASGGAAEEMDGTLVVLEFFERGQQTEIVLTHYGLSTEQLRKDHTQGWNICFDNLEALLK